MEYPTYSDLTEFIDILNHLATKKHCKPSHFEVNCIDKNRFGFIYEVKLDNRAIAKLFPLEW